MRLFPGYANKYKKYFAFFSPNIRMSEKSVNFDGKKINKSNFFKHKKLFKKEDVDVNKILVSKKNHMIKKAHLKALLDILIMMTLDLYV